MRLVPVCYKEERRLSFVDDARLGPGSVGGPL
ncbi:hypothetical protein [Pseudomonas phage PhiPizzaParty]|nr:hypothetical protein [Pseudomonas phage PhiPizzaParty]